MHSNCRSRSISHFPCSHSRSFLPRYFICRSRYDCRERGGVSLLESLQSKSTQSADRRSLKPNTSTAVAHALQELCPRRNRLLFESAVACRATDAIPLPFAPKNLFTLCEVRRPAARKTTPAPISVSQAPRSAQDQRLLGPHRILRIECQARQAFTLSKSARALLFDNANQRKEENRLQNRRCVSRDCGCALHKHVRARNALDRSTRWEIQCTC